MNRQTDMNARFNALMNQQEQAQRNFRGYNTEETPDLISLLQSDKVRDGKIVKTSFLESNYFLSMCELAHLFKTKEKFYCSKENEPLILSLLGKNIIGIVLQKNNSLVVNFFDNTETNRYLFDKNGQMKSENVEKFKEILKELAENKRELKLFSLTPIKIEPKQVQTLEF